MSLTTATNQDTVDSKAQQPVSSWRLLLHPRVITLLFLGFSAGIPILLIFSSLSLWLAEAGTKKSAVTFFSWAALGYSFKFVWAPLVDKLPLPLLTRILGRRRSWMLLSQLAVIASICWMALVDPSTGGASLTLMAFAAVSLGFSSATQDIVIDAYRIEAADSDMQALLSSTYVAGYRIGMLVAGAGALYLAARLGSTAESYNYLAWRWTYMAMAGVMLIGVATTLLIGEPEHRQPDKYHYEVNDYVRFFCLFLFLVIVFVLIFRFTSFLRGNLSDDLTAMLGNRALSATSIELVRLALATFCAWLVARTMVSKAFVSERLVRESYYEPVIDFFKRYGSAAILLLAIIGVYRMSDIVLGVVANLFYQDMGFSKEQIAAVAKTFGLLAIIAGGFLGGLMSIRFGVIKILWLGAALSAATNLLFVLLANSGAHVPLLYLVIFADNIAAGLATAAFIAFLSSLTNISFTAVQYAIFSSLMTLFPKILGGYSGTLVESLGYSQFFILTALLTLPVLVLIPIAARFLQSDNE